MDSDEGDNRISMSVLEFCQRAKDLLQNDQADFVRFTLTGQDTDGTQACIDPIRNRLAAHEYERLKCTRDYDSLLGISESIHVNTHLTLYPIARRNDTLSENIHLTYEFTTANVCFLSLCSTR